MRLYVLRIGNTIYSTRVKTDARALTKTCIVGMPDKQIAVVLKNKLVKKGIQKIHVSDFDYESAEFNAMMRLNNLALLIARDFEFDEKVTSISGDLLDVELPVNDDHRNYLEMIFHNRN